MKILKKLRNNMGRIYGMACAGAMATQLATTTALAIGADSVTVSVSSDVEAASLMGNIIGILLSITRYVGVALVIYGVYEIVMSFMQNQPEAKTKGIIMALSGVVMVGLKSIIHSVGLV